jgi:predicted enzyme related to lactoylglutathione lyase
MTNRDSAPIGAPCWTDLWTSDVDGTRSFYSELFGWEAQEPNPEFGGYFMFTRDGVPVAGCMGPMQGAPAPSNRWTVYLTTDDIEKMLASAESEGAQVVLPLTAVADLGSQAVLLDPTGARVGAWQPGTFPGCTVLDEHGTPSWFELHTRDHAKAVQFYTDIFRWETTSVGDTDEFRYTVMRNPSGDGELAGIMDAKSFLPEGTGPSWFVYWEVDDIDATAARLVQLGGSVSAGPEDTPYGRIASVTEPTGAQFKLRTAPGK